jgi:PIN domain
MGLNGITFDAGALIGFDRADRLAVALVARARERHEAIAVPAGVVGQAWRNGRRQANLARLLASESCEVVPLDDYAARAAGQLCGGAGTVDVIDASVVVCARARGQRIATGDPDDIRRLDPRVELVIV